MSVRTRTLSRQRSTVNALKKPPRHTPLVLDPMGSRDMVPSYERRATHSRLYSLSFLCSVLRLMPSRVAAFVWT